MNGFVVFENSILTETFLTEFTSQHPTIASKLMKTATPTRLIAQHLTTEEIQTLKLAIESRGKWFDDVLLGPGPTPF